MRIIISFKYKSLDLFTEKIGKALKERNFVSFPIFLFIGTHYIYIYTIHVLGLLERGESILDIEI